MTLEEEDLLADIAQTERIGLSDVFIATVIAAGVWGLQELWALPIVHPANWADVAVATGVRPAEHIAGGFFTTFASYVYRTFGSASGDTILGWLGRLSLCGIAVVAYGALREMLAFVMRARPQRSTRRTFVMQIASVVGTFAFIASEPLWRAGQFLSETTILLALMVFSMEFFLAFLRKGTLGYAYVSMFFLGLLTAESPIGIVLLILYLMVNNVVLKVLPVFESAFFKPAVMEVGKWYLSAVFFVALLLGIAINCAGFVLNDGLVVLGKSLGDLPVIYLYSYVAQITTAATPGGWILWAGVCLTPFIVAMMRFPAAADEETFLPYSTGFVFVICGIIAIAQVSPVPVLWFWTHFPVPNDFLLSLGMLFISVTLASTVTILGVDSICRDHARLARQLYGAEEDDTGERVSGSFFSTLIRRTIVVILPTMFVAVAIFSRMDAKTRNMLCLVRDALDEIVREAGDATYLFTDGNLDTGIELTSHKKGGSLMCLPLVSRTANSPRDVYLRTRGMSADKEDGFSFGCDVGMGLRSWIRDRPERLAKSAVMMGFDLWKRDGKALPPFGGMLSRPCGWPSEDERKSSIARARDLIARVLEIHAMRGSVTSTAVKDAFLAVQWRLSRLCTYRGEQADLDGDAKSAIAEVEMANRLNACNETYQDVLAAMSRQNDIMMSRLTPREGLQLALVRADFTMGKMYAETILVGDPENPDANFAMGMYYVKDRQLARAKEYLTRCLVRRPKEPSIYNNLAMIELEQGDFDAAEANVRKALAIIPDSAAVKDTLNQIKTRRAEKAKK